MLAAPDRHTVWSPGGSFRLEVVFAQVGFDDLSVARILVWEGDVLRWAADRPTGNGFHLSNLGSVAAIEASEAGARVEVMTGERGQVREMLLVYGYCSQAWPRLHFGLGAVARVDTLRSGPAGARASGSTSRRTSYCGWVLTI